jgi:hypothetical protein
LAPFVDPLEETMSKLQPCLRYKLLLFLICILSLFGLSITTSSAQETYQDPVLEAARAAGLITTINKSKTIDDVTLTLDWAYADVQRIALGYTVQTKAGKSPEALFTNLSSAKLTDDKKAMFSFASGYPAQSEDTNKTAMVVEFHTQAMVPIKDSTDFDLNNDYFNPAPKTVNLTFDPQLGELNQSPLPISFSFTLPLYPAVIVKPKQTVRVNNIPVTLEQLTITPAKTTARVCYDLPDNRDWIPEGSVSINGQQGLTSGMSLVGGKQADFSSTHRCHDLSYNVFHDAKAAAFDLTLDHFSVSMSEGPDDWNKIKAELAKHNIQIEVISVSHGLDVKVLSVPDGVNYDQAVNEAREALGDWINGPWTFKVDLPASSAS